MGRQDLFPVADVAKVIDGVGRAQQPARRVFGARSSTQRNLIQMIVYKGQRQILRPKCGNPVLPQSALASSIFLVSS